MQPLRGARPEPAPGSRGRSRCTGLYDVSRHTVTAEQPVADARAGPENRPAASGGSLAPIRVLNVGMTLVAAVVYVVAVAPLGGSTTAMILPIAALVVGFAVGEGGRVFIHFEGTERRAVNPVRANRATDHHNAVADRRDFFAGFPSVR